MSKPVCRPDEGRYRTKDGEFEVRLTAAALGHMLEECRASGDRETGGILIGRYSPDRVTAVVERATGPGGGARSGATWLIRGVRGLQGLLDRLWSRGRGYYLGEWHFHPRSAPKPSRQDRRQMREIAVSCGYHCPEALLVIIGGDPNGSWSLHVEVCLREGRVLPLVAT